MQKNTKVYFAGSGMITAVGGNSAMTLASVNAGINQYIASDYEDYQGQSITMTEIPEMTYNDMPLKILGSHYSELNERIIKMAILAMREAVSDLPSQKSFPLILAMPEDLPGITHIEPTVLIKNLLNNHDLPVLADQTRYNHSGRAAGIEAVDLAYRILHDLNQDYVIVGGSDSFWHFPIIKIFDDSHRLLAPKNSDGFAPGEGAGFIVLTKDPKKAVKKHGYIIAFSPPGTGLEEGNILSDGSQPYRGDGLDKAIKATLETYQGKAINCIYSSMNGEAYWAKEYGVSLSRNQQHFTDDVKHLHPADAYGDLGAATGPVLMGLSAINMLNSKTSSANLVYSSSDGAHRAAILLEKIPLTH